MLKFQRLGETMKFSKKIVFLIVFLNVAFTSAVLYLNYHDHSVSDSLVTGWFSFTGVELLGMVAIKVVKVRKE